MRVRMYSILRCICSHSAAHSYPPESHACRLCNYHSNCSGDESHDLRGFTHITNIWWRTSIWWQPCILMFGHTQARQRLRTLVPLLVTCNYVAMMSLIFCTGWRLHDAKRLESAGKCLAVWNTNMLICEQWLKGKCFSMPPPPNPPQPPLLMFTSTELRLKERPTEWVSGRLTQPWRTCWILAVWQADRPAPEPWVDREEGKIKGGRIGTITLFPQKRHF